MSYNVLKEPWIPMSDGKKYSLWECLERAHELERISCSSPLETYAVHRFMCAFVMDALQVNSKAERFNMLKRERFDMEVFDAYVKMCEAEGISFDLFDERRPFMQAGYDPEYDKEEKSVAKMVLSAPAGSNHVFFEHIYENEQNIQVDSAFRNMLTQYVFCVKGGRGYFTSVNGMPCIYVIVQGKTLFDTLLLNVISKKECGNLPYGTPSWRDMEKRSPAEESATMELLKGLTWQPRRITFINEKDGLVKKLYYTSGRKSPMNPLWRDPHVSYFRTKDGTFLPIKPQEGRALWRDLGGMAASKEDGHKKQPQVIAALPDQFSWCNIMAIGLIAQDASLIDIVCEEMLIPTTIINNEDHGDTLRQDLDFIESIDRYANKVLEKSVSPVVKEDLENAFLASARDYVFSQYFDALSLCETDESYVALQEDVENNLFHYLKDMFKRLSLRLGHDAKSMIQQSNIQREILKGYYKLRRERHGE